MTHARPGARGGRAARRTNTRELEADRLKARGTLARETEVAEQARAEALPCPICNEVVHPSNWQRHMQRLHPGKAIALHEAQQRLPLAAIRTDGGTQPRAEINDEVVQDYADALQAGATLPPLTVYFDGQTYWLADGFHRAAAARQIGWLDYPAVVHQGTQRDAVLHSVGVNATHGLRRTNADKRRAVERLLRDDEWGKWSDREIARRCAVTHPYVTSIRKLLSGNDYQMERTVQRGGTTYQQNISNIGKRASVSYGPREDDYQDDVPTVETDERPVYIERAEPVGIITPKTTPREALHSSLSNEWYTPALYIQAVRELLGGIDVDPASHPAANAVVRATTYYTLETNGLAHDWPGRVWLNPPYGRDEDNDSNQDVWSARLLEQYAAGITTEAVLLVNAATDRKWFQRLWAYPICFTNHRIRFIDSDGVAQNSPTNGNAFVYLGKQRDRFIRLFGAFGTVVERAK